MKILSSLEVASSRRNFLKRSLVGGGVAAAAGSLPFTVPQLFGQTPANDIDLLNYALMLEHLESAFYRDELARFTPRQFRRRFAGFDIAVRALRRRVARDNTASLNLPRRNNAPALGTNVTTSPPIITNPTTPGTNAVPTPLFPAPVPTPFPAITNTTPFAPSVTNVVTTPPAVITNATGLETNVVPNPSPFPNPSPIFTQTTTPETNGVTTSPSSGGSTSNTVGNSNVGNTNGNEKFNSVYELFTEIRDHEAAHVQFLTQAIQLLGGTPVPELQYNFGVNSLGKFIALAQLFENTGVSAYDGVIASFESPVLRTTGATLATVEARHASFVNLINGSDPFPQAADTPKSMAEITASVAPFIVG